MTRVLVAFLAAVVTSAASGQTQQLPPVGEILVNFRGYATLDNGSRLPDSLRSELTTAIDMPVVELDHTWDGACRLGLTTALSLDGARALVNQVQLLPDVLYASTVVSPAAATTGAPVEKPDRRRVHRYAG